MITFTSIADMDKLADDDPAKPVVKQLLEWLIAPGDFPDHPYNPEDHGFIGFVIPVDAPWIDGELRAVLESLLDDPSPLTFRSTTL